MRASLNLLADEPESFIRPRDIHAEKSDRITGWRLVTIYVVGFVWSWSVFIGIAIGLGNLAQFLAGL
jgi:hypothetical protein